MRTSVLPLAIAALLAFSLSNTPAISADTLRLAGTGGAMPMAQHMAAQYLAASGTTIEVIPGLGSGGAIRAAADGAIDLAISGRQLTPKEVALGLTAVPIARTAFVFVTSRTEPTALRSADLVGIFTSPDPKWADGSTIEVILRTPQDGDTLILESLFAGMHAAIETARLRPEIPVAATDQDSAALAEQLDGSFVQAGYSQIVTEKRHLRFIAIDGVEPTPENFEAGKYPYEKVFYLVYAAKDEAAAQRLLDFLRSAGGVEGLRATGNLPVVQ
jgi:phosphate transport system substrate-binding protein